jgi:hypothetical protein
LTEQSTTPSADRLLGVVWPLKPEVDQARHELCFWFVALNAIFSIDKSSPDAAESYQVERDGDAIRFVGNLRMHDREAEIWNCLEEHRQSDSAGAKKEAKRSRMRGTK